MTNVSPPIVRASIEDEYARKLLALSRKALGTNEIGCLKTSLDVARMETESMAKQHQSIAAQMRTELEEPLAAFAGAIKERRKIIQSGIEKLLKTKIQQTQHVAKVSWHLLRAHSTQYASWAKPPFLSDPVTCLISEAVWWLAADLVRYFWAPFCRLGTNSNRSVSRSKATLHKVIWSWARKRDETRPNWKRHKSA